MKLSPADFTALVIEMRKAQKAYFHASKINHPTKSKYLQESKDLEKKVDHYLTDFDKGIGFEQGRLF